MKTSIKNLAILTIMIIFAAITKIHAANIDHYINSGDSTYLTAGNTYYVYIKNGGTCKLIITDQSATGIQWIGPFGVINNQQFIYTTDPGSYGCYYNSTNGAVAIDIYIRYFVDIIDSTPGSSSYGQYPDSVGHATGMPVTLTAGNNFVGGFWGKVGQSGTMWVNPNSTFTITDDGTYWFQCGDADNYVSSDTVKVYTACTLSIVTIDTAICETQMIFAGGAWQNTAGTYHDTLTNTSGCDSIIITHLSVNQPTTSTQNISACESYTWFGTTYTASGTHTHVIPNAHGCDSTITLNLAVVNQFTMNIIPDTVIVIQGHTDTVYVTVDDEVTLLWSTGSDSLSAIISATGWCYVTATHSVCGSQIDSVYVDVITGISEPADNNRFDVKVCPNPATDFIQISAYELVIEDIEIYNQIGQLVLRVVDKSSMKVINVSMLSKGCYYLKIDTKLGENAKLFKVMIE